MKSTITKFFLFSVFILGIIVVPSISFSESEIQVQEGEINVEISPESPEPYQEVTIRVSSFATDLNKALITWKNNGSAVLSGIGKTSYTFKALGSGEPSNFSIVINPVGSITTLRKNITITPSEVEIVWESLDGYTPPFYRGKSLPISGGRIKAVAIPSTKTIKSGNGSISYTWKNNGDVVQDASGYNKNEFVFKNNMFDESNKITVIASSITGNYNAESTITIPVYKPKVVFYKKSPTEGVLYNKALEKETTMQEDEMTFVAEPYFLSIGGNENDFIYNWKINGEQINTPSKKTELTVRPTSRGGYATINIDIENLDELFQKVSNTLKINL